MLTNTLTGEQISDAELASIATLCDQMANKAKQVEQLETSLELARGQLKRLEQELLPEAMQRIGLAEVKLSDGRKLTISPFYSGSIKDENAQAAYSWLRANECDGIIKTKVELDFGKGQTDGADKAYDLLVSQGFAPSKKQGVHPQTLKGFIRERVENGQPIPTDLFGVFIGNKAKLK